MPRGGAATDAGMVRHHLARLARLAALAALVGCSGEPEADLETARAPIMQGVVDTTHPSAVALIGSSTHPEGLVCSASIIAVDPPWAWLLTASHCPVGGAVIARVGHLDEPPVQELVVVEHMMNPDYNGHPSDDYAVLRALGADGTTPFVPLATASEDALAVGDTVTLVGYGKTETPTVTNFDRRVVDRSIFQLAADVITYDTDTAGMCSGDSGGPTYANLPAGERVVGIHSAVEASDCIGKSYDMRASHVFSSFVEPRIDKPTFDVCGQCFGPALTKSTACGALHEVCTTPGSDCLAYTTCLSGCASDPTCEAGCAASHPVGASDHAARIQCACQLCSPVCSDAPGCGGQGTGCGYTSNDPACTTCIQGCCTEAQACEQDPGCAGVFPNAPGNPNAIALEQCLDNSQCLGTCGLVMDPGTGGGGQGGAGGSSSASVGGGSGVTTTSAGAGGATTTGPTSSGAGAASSGAGEPTPNEPDDTRPNDRSGGCQASPTPSDAGPIPWLAWLGLCLLGRRRRPTPAGRSSV